jgi:hypothetical protein
MGLDMYLNRVPKCNSIEELEQLNDRLSDAYADGEIHTEMQSVLNERKLIYSIPFAVETYCDIEKWRKNKKEWGQPVKLGERMAYWRKFNALHSWMVKNVQDGEDDCGTYIVTEEHLKQLQSELKDINEQNAKEILPTAAGFFFGGTEYNEYYWRDIENLKCTVNHLINHSEREYMYTYHASW